VFEKCFLTQTYSRLQPTDEPRTQTAHRITHLAIEMANPISLMPCLPQQGHWGQGRLCVIYQGATPCK